MISKEARAAFDRFDLRRAECDYPCKEEIAENLEMHLAWLRIEYKRNEKQRSDKSYIKKKGIKG